MLRIEIPELSVVALMGASGSGKSTFAKQHFKATEILSSDYFRGLVSDDETDQSATKAAFDSLYYIAAKRIDAGKLVVIDATNVQQNARDAVIRLAREHDLLATVIVFDIDEETCLERNRERPDRNFGAHVVRNHIKDLRRSVRNLKREGFRYIHTFKSPEEMADVEIVRTKLWNDKRDESGPFDIIGDVHGCYDELCSLLEKMNYSVDRAACAALPPDGRRAIFLGDLCDRGPKNIEVLSLVMNMSAAGHALCIPGNHDVKLLRKLRGADVKLNHGLGITVEQMEIMPAEFKERAAAFIDGLVSHYVLDRGKLLVAHAGLKEAYQGRSSGRVREFCLYGDTTGETDEFGLPVRLDWADDYRGKALVVYGHVPSREVRSLNNTLCIDTGCVFGGKLTAYRYPEGELVEIAAQQEYYAPVKPLDYGAENKTENTPGGDLLDIADVLGKRRILTGLGRQVTIGEESGALTLEIMSRFSADPRWLIYLPPTMSPCETSNRELYLEYPQEAFDYFQKQGIEKVICEEKHMGSRAVMILCRNAEAAQKRFGIDSIPASSITTDNPAGIIYTRTGRHFFDPAERVRISAQADPNDLKNFASPESIILSRLKKALDQSGFWDAFSTDWVCLDTELMPWSAKARQLLVDKYALAGRAGRNGLAEATAALSAAAARQGETAIPPDAADPHAPQNMNIQAVLDAFRTRVSYLALYTDAYHRYCWDVNSADDYRVAPFNILATEGQVWNLPQGSSNGNHLYQLDCINRYISNAADPLFISTANIVVDLKNATSLNEGIAWWLALTEKGGEGMVVKPLNAVECNKGGLIQPAVKCRGREYLRIIYGPEYTDPPRLERLRKRSLAKKRRLALDEFSLSVEALDRFVKKEPLRRLHECVFAILAMENEKVDPRL
jgi:protein phosphatase